MMSDLKIAELFAGMGGVAGGFMDAGGFDPVFLNDIDSSARNAFVQNFPNLKDRYQLNQVENLTGNVILDFAGGQIDGLLGCPPCQGLSQVGPRRKHDHRNALLFEMHRLVWSISPKFFVMENVPRLLNTSYFQNFEESISRRYKLHAEIINAAEYGIPQLRRRAVVIGFRKHLDIEPSLPEPTHGGDGRVFNYSTGTFIKSASQTGRKVLMLRPKVSLGEQPLVRLQDALGDLPSEVTPEQDTWAYETPPTTTYQQFMRSSSDVQVTNHRPWLHRQKMIDRLKTVAAGHCPIEYGNGFRNTTYFSQAYARLHPFGLARTITTNFHNPGSGRFTHYAAHRALTVREALRIQGFPDKFTFNADIPYKDAERLVGNAFPRLLAAAIGRHIRSLISS